jgi:hypothetical protein
MSRARKRKSHQEFATASMNVYNTIKKYSEGNILLMENNAHIREGVVIKPL